MRSSRSRSARRERLEPRERQWGSYIDLYPSRANPPFVRHLRTSLFEVSRQSMISIHNLKDPSGPILFDGGFGAALQYRGLTSGTPPETWNIARPEEVRKLHAEFVAAGSAIIE